MSMLSLKRGIFKEELKNRFLCLVEVDGEDALCYIPSSCRLSNFVDMAGKTVLLSPVASANSKTKYTVEALSVGNEFVLLNMSKANNIVSDNIHSRRFAILGNRANVKKECTIDGYKSDLFIEDTKTIVEIKSILSFYPEAKFPTVYSQRAIDQLNRLESLLDKGFQACYIFVSLNPKVKKLMLNDEIIGYQEAFCRCIRKGMKVKGIVIRYKDGDLFICNSLKIQLDSNEPCK